MTGTARAVALVAIWVAVAAIIVGCALAWGAEGRVAVVLLGVIGLAVAMIASLAVSGSMDGQRRADRG